MLKIQIILNKKIKKYFPNILIQEIPELTFRALQPIRGQISFKIQQNNIVLSYKDSDNQVFY